MRPEDVVKSAIAKFFLMTKQGILSKDKDCIFYSLLGGWEKIGDSDSKSTAVDEIQAKIFRSHFSS